MLGKVAVLTGGNSIERDASLQTGQLVFDALQRKGIDAVLIDTRDDYIGALQAGNFDRAFIALHGRTGGDGTIQGLLECLNIPYTGSKVLGSALAMDKVRSKRIWQGLGLATPPFAVWEPGTGPDEYVKIFGLPLSIKPALESAKVVAHRLSSASNFEEACTDASKYGPVLIEPWITGDEYTVSILGKQSLPSVQVSDDISDELQYICPSSLGYAEEENLKLLAKQAFKAVGASDWGCVEFVRDLNGDYWILEVNTVPEIKHGGVISLAAKVAGLSVDELVWEILIMTSNVVSKADYAKS